MEGHVLHEGSTVTPIAARDPVCGMEVPENSRHRRRAGDREYRFCSAHCLERFDRHPEAFLRSTPGGND